MTNATFSDALVGYRFFLASRGEASIGEINALLERRGRTPISPRTYGHYAKLVQRGFTTYLPINQFDVLNTIGRLSAAADRRRHNRFDASGVVMMSPDGVQWMEGQIVDVSDVGVGVAFRKSARITKGDAVIVRLPETSDFPATVVWTRQVGRRIRAGLRAFEHIPNGPLIPHRPEPKRRGILVLHRIEPGEIPWLSVRNILARVDELTQAARDLLLALQTATEVEAELGEPVVHKIEFGSPGTFELKIDIGVEKIIRLVLEKVQFWREQKRELRAKVKSLELANSLREIETLRNAYTLARDIEKSPLASGLALDLRDLTTELLPGAKIPRNLFAPGTPERAILDRRILPAALEINAGDDPGFNAKTSTEE